MNWNYDKLENTDIWDIKTEIHELEKEGFSYVPFPKESWHIAVDFCDPFEARDAFNRGVFGKNYRFSLENIWDSAENLKVKFGNKNGLLSAKAIRFYSLNRFLEDKRFVRKYRLKEIQEDERAEQRKVAKMIFNGKSIPGKYIGREINLDDFSIMAC